MVQDLCGKIAKKLNVLQRITDTDFIDYSKRNILFQSMIKSQFSYCPLISMFCSRRSKFFMSNIHERTHPNPQGRSTKFHK